MSHKWDFRPAGELLWAIRRASSCGGRKVFKRRPNGLQTARLRRPSREPPARSENHVRGTFRETFRGTFLPSVKNEMLSLGLHLGLQKRENNKP